MRNGIKTLSTRHNSDLICVHTSTQFFSLFDDSLIDVGGSHGSKTEDRTTQLSGQLYPTPGGHIASQTRLVYQSIQQNDIGQELLLKKTKVKASLNGWGRRCFFIVAAVFTLSLQL